MTPDELTRLELTEETPLAPWQRYVHAIEEREVHTPERERMLIVFAAWLNIRKEVALPSDPKALVYEFLSNQEALNTDEKQEPETLPAQQRLDRLAHERFGLAVDESMGEEPRIERYYVQRQGPENFLVRELQQPGDQPGSADLTIRRFSRAERAWHYRDVVNELQQQLDAAHGAWKMHAVLPSEEESQDG